MLAAGTVALAYACATPILGADLPLHGNGASCMCSSSVPAVYSPRAGPRGFPAWGIKPNATLYFEIEILKIQ